jgi:hypothetical protein
MVAGLAGATPDGQLEVEPGGVHEQAVDQDGMGVGAGQKQLDWHDPGHHVGGRLEPGRPTVLGLRLRRLGCGMPVAAPLPICPPRVARIARPASAGTAADGPSSAPGRDLVGHSQPATTQVGITHWSTRLLARELGVSRDTIAGIWREYGIQPWRAETFRFSTDPQLAAKVHDVVGLYLHPPERAVVLCVDEKSQIQALERTQPVRRVWPGRPEQRTHEQ